MYTLENFKRDADAELKKLAEAMSHFPWENKRAYADWCAQTYYYVCHSTRLLALASGHCAVADQPLHRRFIDHLTEEKGHEKLASNDVKNLGLKLEDYPERPQTALFYQNQYYWLSRNDGKTIFGWIIALEGNAVYAGKPAFDRAIQSHGRGTASFLKVHSEEDVDHLQKAFDFVENFSESELLKAKKNLAQSIFLYVDILNSIAAEAKYQRSAA
jgi:hypothetical protein